ncbi:MAG: hemerythrin domain-containing protein [Nitrospirota bacterium]
MGVAIEQLKKEHSAIERMLAILELVNRKLQAGEPVDAAHVSQIIEFFHGFADECHHGKEETVLFPALEKVGIPREGGPVGVMLHEHDQMRGYLRGVGQAVERMRAGEVGAAYDIVRYAGDYASTLRRHIDKENNMLFRMAEMRLGPDQEQRLAERFEAVETEKMGAGKHEALHALLDRLEGIYLGGKT